MLSESLSLRQEQHHLAMHGIEGFLEKYGEGLQLQARPSKNSQLFQKITQDSTLRYPHRKILEFLSGQYDYQHGRFKEIHFSALVRECRLGKNKAKEYLGLLVEKGYLARRDDGYRIWYKLQKLPSLFRKF